MNGKPMLYLDQFGYTFFARTVKELHAQIGGARPSKMYVDKKDGRKSVHIGYVVGGHWLRAYEAVDFGPVAPSR